MGVVGKSGDRPKYFELLHTWCGDLWQRKVSLLQTLYLALYLSKKMVSLLWQEQIIRHPLID